MRRRLIHAGLLAASAAALVLASGLLGADHWQAEGPHDSSTEASTSAEASRTDVWIVQTPYSDDEIWAISLELVGHIVDAGVAVDGFGPNAAHDTIELMGPELSTDDAAQERVLDLAEHIVPRDITIAFIPNEVAVLYDVRP